MSKGGNIETYMYTCMSLSFNRKLHVAEHGNVGLFSGWGELVCISKRFGLIVFPRIILSLD